MLQHVNTVLVSNVDLLTSYDGKTEVGDLSTKEIFIENEKGGLVYDNTTAANAKAIRFGYITDETLATAAYGAITAGTERVVKYSPYIQKNSVKSATFTEYEAKQEASIKFNLAACANPIVGNRYVVRFIYRDVYEHPGQFTKTYEVIASTVNKADLIAALVARINKDLTKRINITSDSAYATDFIATAIEKTDNEGKESINIYTQVQMEAVMYYTNPQGTGFTSKIKNPMNGIVYTKVNGKPGKGYWKQVRDREQAALAYAGFQFRNVWPYSQMKPSIVADSTVNYDSFIVEFENKFLTPDNQKNANTMQSVELYFKDTSLDTTKSIITFFNAFNA